MPWGNLGWPTFSGLVFEKVGSAFLFAFAYAGVFQRFTNPFERY
jgi:hypothetical protein